MGVPEVDSHRWLTAGDRPSTASRRADHALVGGQRHHDFQLAAPALLSCGRLIPRGQAHLAAEAFSPNTPAGRVPTMSRLGRIYDATEQSMVPDDSLTIRERAIAAWPPAWHGQNLRDILVDWATTWIGPGGTCRSAIGTGSSSPKRQPTGPVYAGLHAGGNATRAQAQGGAELPGHVQRARGASCCTPSPTRRAR